MWIMKQQSKELVNLDRFDTLSIDTEKKRIYAIRKPDFEGSAPLKVCMGSYNSVEECEEAIMAIHGALADGNFGPMVVPTAESLKEWWSRIDPLDFSVPDTEEEIEVPEDLVF